ncbi:MAG: hypothetical protein HY725_05735 [Candidatus Rokubacteria bacterium]|nr:hypothetical protein [Candidatus Rokubacteria bacterium]
MRGLLLLGWLLLLAVLLWPIVRRFLPPRRAGAGRPRAIQDELVKDPVCQTYVLRSRAVTRAVGGVTRYFCSRECAARFAAIRGER